MRQACKTEWESKVDLPVDIQIQLRALVLVECLQQTAVFQFVKKNTHWDEHWAENFISVRTEGRSKMKALQVQANKGLLSLEDLPKPEVMIMISNDQEKASWLSSFWSGKNTQVVAEDDVIIKVGFAGLCGTDLHIVSVCLCFWTQHCQFKQQYIILKKILKDQSNENTVNNCN